ncbi:hypothetical protein MKX07_003767 [Trichoderma sp. CBMAI-0711]|nr:hypothetical protein MKX07_003767 [Trichoderma sp. CBMAI-0711]
MSQPSLATHLEKKFHTTGRDAFNDQSDFYALSTLLYEMIDDSNQDSSEFGLTYLVVDSIEELCINDDIKSKYHSGPSIDDLIQLISKSTQISTRIKWLVSAVQHHRSVALTEMDVATQETLRIDDHLDSHVRQNIITKEYVPLRVAEIAKRTGFREPFQSQVNARLSNLVPSNFLWVDMACHHIKVHGLPWNATAVLDKLPRDLTGLYGETFQNIPSLGFKQDRDMCYDILFTTAITFRTLHKTEVESLLELPPSVDLDILVKRMCSFFLEFYADNLCYVHSSAREFVREHLAGHHDLSSKQLEMTTRCLRQAVAKNKPRSDTYAITNWVQHLMRVSREEHLSQAIEQVNVFFDDHFLEWAEVLTKRSLLLEAAVRLQRLSKFLKDMVTSPPTEQQVQCIQNTQQMLWLLNFRQTNSLDNLSPKYCLPFLPSDSKLRQGLLQKAFPWLAIAPHIDHSAAHIGAVHVLNDHGDWVRCCCYSPDGRLIASGGDDGVVRCWDAETFKVQHTFSVGSYVRRVLFSSDQLLLALSESTIKIWNSSTGQLVNDVQSSNDDFRDLHISPDGKEIVATRGATAVTLKRSSEATDNLDESDLVMDYDADCSWRVFLWDVEEKKTRHLFSEHDANIDGLAFSHDSKYLASASDDKTHRLEGHEDWVRCAVVSPDGKFVASGSDDRSVRLWDISENRNDDGNRELRLFRGEQGHRDYVYAVAFSPNGRYLASGGDDLQVLIWDLKLGDQSADQPVTMTTTSGESIRGLTFTDDEARVVSWESNVKFTPTRLQRLTMKRPFCDNGGKPGVMLASLLARLERRPDNFILEGI